MTGKELLKQLKKLDKNGLECEVMLLFDTKLVEPNDHNPGVHLLTITNSACLLYGDTEEGIIQLHYTDNRKE